MKCNLTNCSYKQITLSAGIGAFIASHLVFILGGKCTMYIASSCSTTKALIWWVNIIVSLGMGVIGAAAGLILGFVIKKFF